MATSLFGKPECHDRRVADPSQSGLSLPGGWKIPSRARKKAAV